VKYNHFDKEQRSKEDPQNPFRPEHLFYNKEQDCYYCPMGQKMENIGTGKRKSASAYEQTVTYYQARNCQGCPLQGACHTAADNRIIEINHSLNRLKQQAAENLRSEQGVMRRKLEAGILALAHNLRKKAA
jgi:hypothetical protein